MTSASRDRAAIAGSLSADDINWSVTPVRTWASTERLSKAAIALLPEIADDLTADLVEALALALAEAREQVAATRTILTEALGQLHSAQREIRRLKVRLAALLEAQRGNP